MLSDDSSCFIFLFGTFNCPRNPYNENSNIADPTWDQGVVNSVEPDWMLLYINLYIFLYTGPINTYFCTRVMKFDIQIS